MLIQGTVAPGFESVKRLYEHNMRHLAERNTQLCVYVGESRVVDLWASARNETDFSGDTLVNVFSSGKSLESIALAMLADRGFLDFNKEIATYWPEFAAQDKQRITVADLMRHEAGMAAFDQTLAAIDMQPEGLLANKVGAVIENQAPRYRMGNNEQREYHAITRGWIANEVFRRAEPNGRTMGQFLRHEVSERLDADVYIGLRDDELGRVCDVAMLGIGYQLMQGLVPKALGRRIELNLAQSVAKVWRLRSGMKSRTTNAAPVPIAGMKSINVFNSAAVAKAEIPSAGAKCSARGLAKLAAVMACGGAPLMGSAAYQTLHGEPVKRSMMSMPTTFTQGGLAHFAQPDPNDGALSAGLNSGREGYYGWMGLGGSIFQWQPQHKIGFAYVPTSLNVLDIVNERGKAYQAEVVRCLQAR